MRVFHDPASLRHDPETYFRRGSLIAHPEQAERFRILRDAVAAAGHDLAHPVDRGLAPILAIHDEGYVDFLRQTWARRQELPHIADEILTGHFARPQMRRRPDGLLGLLGYYTADTSTPIRAGTWDAVYGSAQAAINAAEAAIDLGHAYALSRPPGHHAYAASAGGFCYLNNSSIAAERLRGALGGPVAILDLDVHHGNGTQGIFYARGDVQTVSVHADPSDYFPYFAGYADETGSDAGLGWNSNLPLAPGADDDVWLEAVMQGLEIIEARRPTALVVALGLDMCADDPLGVLKVTHKGLIDAATAIARASRPTVIVQEGGYLCDALPHNLTTFLAAFDEAAERRGRVASPLS